MFKQKGKISFIILLILLILTTRCNNIKPANEPANETKKSTVINVAKKGIDTIFVNDRDTVILLKDGEAFIKGQMNAKKSSPVYTLPVWQGQVVLTVLTPLVKGGNVCLHQVQKPGGALEGPFADSARHTIETHGNIRFIIGEKLKGGSPYMQDFILHVTVQ